MTKVKKNDVIILSNGEEGKVLAGDESAFHNIYVVELRDGTRRVVDRKTLSLTRQGL